MASASRTSIGIETLKMTNFEIFRALRNEAGDDREEHDVEEAATPQTWLTRCCLLWCADKPASKGFLRCSPSDGVSFG